MGLVSLSDMYISLKQSDTKRKELAIIQKKCLKNHLLAIYLRNYGKFQYSGTYFVRHVTVVRIDILEKKWQKEKKTLKQTVQKHSRI